MKHPLIVYIVACLWCWGTLAPLKGVPLWVLLSGESNASEPANPINHAVFAGSQYLRASSMTPSGLSNTKTFTVAFWIKMNGGDGTSQNILTISYGTVLRFSVSRGTTGKIRAYAYNVGQSEIFQLTGASDVVVASGWTHVMLAVDLANTSNRALYINGVNEAATSTWTTYANDWIQLNDPGGVRITIGANKENTPGAFLNAALGELWFNDTYNNVISDYYNAGQAVPVGSNGELPIGSSPVLYYSPGGSGNSWNSNGGTGGALTRTGTLTEDGDPPDYDE